MTKKTSVQVLGIKNAVDYLKSQGNFKMSAVDKAIHDSGFMLQEEIQQSISGNRSEPRSVDTGDFLNSISTDNTKKMESTVKSRVAHSKHLEYGTSKIHPRRHFQNSADRKKSDIINKIQTAVK